MLFFIKFGLVAQWLEHPAHNRQVAGSNPAEPKKFGFVTSHYIKILDWEI